MIKRVLVQITKQNDSGPVLYGWKRTGSTDPLDAENTDWLVSGSPGDGLTAPRVPDFDEVVPYFGTSDVQINSDDVLWLPLGTNPPSGFEAWMMNQSLMGTRNGDTLGRWATCYTCLEDFPQSELTKIKGHWYCTKNGCKEDFE